MSEEQFNTERIEQYLEGTLSKQELQEFEAQMKLDQGLNEVVQMQELVTQGVQNAALKDELNQIHSKLYNGSNKAGKGLGNKIYGIIAIVGIIGLAIWQFSGYEEEPKESEVPAVQTVTPKKVVEEAPIEEVQVEEPTADSTPTIHVEIVPEPEDAIPDLGEDAQSLEDQNSSKTITISTQDTGVDDGAVEGAEDVEATPEENIEPTEEEVDESEVTNEIGKLEESKLDVLKVAKEDDEFAKEASFKSMAATAITPIRFDSLRELLDVVFPHNESSTTTKIGDPRMFLEFKGRRGTFVSIPPNTLVTLDGQAPVGNIRIELKEYYEPYELVARGLPTTSNGRLLESGGVVHLAAYDERENELQIKANGKVGLSLVPEESYKAEHGYSTFYGKMDSTTGFMNWHNENVTENPTVTPVRKGKFKGKTIGKVSSPVIQKFEKYINLETQSLGWINCDKFSDKKTTQYTVPLSGAPANAAVFVIFKNMESIMAAAVGDNTAFFEAPSGEDIWLIGVGTQDGEDYYFIINTTTNKMDNSVAIFETAPRWKIKQDFMQIRFKDIHGLDEKPKKKKGKNTPAFDK